MLKPSLKEIEAIKTDYSRIPVSMEVAADMETPIGLLSKILSKEHCFLLESVEGGEKWARYSFIGFNPSTTVCVKNGQTIIKTKGGEKIFSGNPAYHIRKLIGSVSSPSFDYLPRFTGGAVGYFAYDMVRYVEKLPDNHKTSGDYPDCCLMIVDDLIVYDRLKQKFILIANIKTGADLKAAYLDAEKRIEKLLELINAPAVQPPAAAEKPEWKSNITKKEYEAGVLKAKEYIKNGDIFQVVYSQRFETDMSGSLFHIYRALRYQNPSPYMYYIKTGDIEIAGASPETILRIENGNIEVCPIAGTRPRGRSEQEDKELEKELISDEKELAEHNMLVDLGRNDVGRVSEFGSVAVRDYQKIERYSHVMHLTSLVTGKLKKGKDAYDALNSVLPAGTLSGAPKVRAMEIIDELETLRRGPYGGAIGYIDYNGNIDTCITIRTIVKKGNKAFVQAGAGIVADSVPENEYNESINKAKAIFKAADTAAQGL